MTGTAGDCSSYTHLVVPESIQTADGTAQPVVGKGTVKCTSTWKITFTPVAKISTVRTLVSLAVNDGWKLHGPKGT